MTRRTFFSALAALPFLSRVKPKPNPQAAIDAGLAAVAREGAYQLKKGELVLTPKSYVNLTIDGSAFFKWYFKARRDGTL